MNSILYLASDFLRNSRKKLPYNQPFNRMYTLELFQLNKAGYSNFNFSTFNYFSFIFVLAFLEKEKQIDKEKIISFSRNFS